MTHDDILHQLRVLGTPLTVFDRADSWAASIVAAELNAGAYRLEDLALSNGALALDIGAHVGIVSAWLGLRHPGARLIAFEPCPRNFANLRRTLAANGVRNVTAINAAACADGRALETASVPENSGGSHCVEKGVSAGATPVASIALLPWLDELGIRRIDFLKIDCEGFEYELLTDGLLQRLSTLAGEFHETPRNCAPALLRRCAAWLGAANVHVSTNVRQNSAAEEKNLEL
jgi:FkbM family methyltransferase